MLSNQRFQVAPLWSRSRDCALEIQFAAVKVRASANQKRVILYRMQPSHGQERKRTSPRIHSRDRKRRGVGYFHAQSSYYHFLPIHLGIMFEKVASVVL